ncbi:MAG: ABC transporter permease, partial [Bryobacteraceae bacterium]
MADPDRIYRLLLKLYPARFREEYESPLRRQFLDDYREARGAGRRIIFWFRMLVDLAVSIPAEILREVTQDLNYAARVYRRRALVTGLAVVALALAIGATTGVFSVLNALLLRGLPFHEPERLIQLRAYPVFAIHGQAGMKNIGAHSAYLAGTTEFFTFDMTLGRTDEALRVKVAETQANFFSLLGTEPVIGRPFAPDEDVPGRDGVAIIGYGLWQQAFGGDPRVLGSTIRLNGVPMTVIGVSPPGFDYPAKSAVWTPTQNSPNRLPKRGVIMTERIARLKPGIQLAQGRSMFEQEVRRYAPETLKLESLNRPELLSLRDQLAGPVRQASVVLLGMVAFVLLIACANVAQLLLSRVAERRQELAVRTALGASRARLVQQLVTEATMLTVVASAGGVGVARWASQLASLTQPPPLALQAYTILDWRVLGFATAVALLTGFVFGVLPAWLIGRFQPSQEMTRVQTVTGRSGVSRMRAGLIATQAAFTLVLLAGSATMGRSFLKLLVVDLGYSTDHVVTLNVSLTGTSYFDQHREPQYYEQVLQRLRAVPGVEAAGAVNYLPLIQNLYMGSGLLRTASGRDLTSGIQLAASSDYFRTLKTGIIAGREFTDSDRAGTEPAMIVSEDVAQEIAGSGNVGSAVGKKIFQSSSKDFTNASAYTVVGVIK